MYITLDYTQTYKITRTIVLKYQCLNFSNFLRLVNSAIIKGSSPFTVHYLMFIPTIMSQGTSEQRAEWVGRAFSNQILGTYAQVS